MTTLLEQLSSMTVAVCDTGDLKSIEKFKPQDATTNPSLITAAAQMAEYSDVVDGALQWGESQAKGDDKKVIALALDRLAIEFGLRILKIVPGRVSTEVDARLSFDTKKTVEKGRYLISQYNAAGIKNERVLIKIASTWEGIKAAEILQKEGINCNLTLLFGMHQAVACAEAGVRLISPFVGRILDWYKKAEGKDSYPPTEDPGVVSVTKIYNYYKKHGHKTQVMGASFRKADQIIDLAGCDLLTISPELIGELASKDGELEPKLTAKGAAAIVCVGTCSAFGGIPFADPNPTGAWPVSAIVADKPIINVSGCPPIPEVIAGTLLQFVATGKVPDLDEHRRPKAFFGNTIHDRCYRRPFYDQGKFAKTFDDEGARNGWCLYELGCKGPTTYNACATIKWNGGTSFPIQSGHGCIGCAEPGFWDKGDFYSPLSAASWGKSGEVAPRQVLELAGGAVSVGAALGLASAGVSRLRQHRSEQHSDNEPKRS